VTFAPDSSPPRSDRPYNPLEKGRLADSIIREMLRHEAEKLPPASTFPGAGIYAIYYRGRHSLYEPLAQANSIKWRFPIYVGKATPPGGRKGTHFSEEAPLTASVHRRLLEHADSIAQTKDLSLDDFRCRHLFVDDIWISLAESLLIDLTQRYGIAFSMGSATTLWARAGVAASALPGTRCIPAESGHPVFPSIRSPPPCWQSV